MLSLDVFRRCAGEVRSSHQFLARQVRTQDCGLPRLHHSTFCAIPFMISRSTTLMSGGKFVCLRRVENAPFSAFVCAMCAFLFLYQNTITTKKRILTGFLEEKKCVGCSHPLLSQSSHFLPGPGTPPTWCARYIQHVSSKSNPTSTQP